jgi:hypothetical protein
MAGGMKVAGWDLDLQHLHACGADCGGPLADAWLAYRPGRRASHAGTIYERVRQLHAKLGRRVLPGDLASEYESTDVYRREDQALVRRRIAATPRTLPVGPAPLPVDAAPAPAVVKRKRPNRRNPRFVVPSPESLRDARQLRRARARLALEQLLATWGAA